VTRPGKTELITQLYFTGDPYIANDPWASDPSAQMRIVPINNNEAVFDITLGSTAGLDEVQTVSPVSVAPNPFTDRFRLSSNATMTNIEIFDLSGRLVKTDYDFSSSDRELTMSGLGAGVYFCRVQTVRGIFIHKLVKQ
jgi:hypothetical protein